jgi:two-component system, sporulation sensor kinase E
LIVRRIVREHGGELSIQSSEGKGLMLTIRLPYIDKRVRMLEAGERRRDEGGGRKDEKG